MKVRLCFLILTLCLSVPVIHAKRQSADKFDKGDSETTLVDRLAHGIYRWKTSKEKHPWWHCGKGVEGQAAVDKAYEWAALAVSEAQKAGKKYDYEVNVWEMAGTMLNESAFDECALGLYPRLWAYDKGYLKPKKRHITHSREEIDELLKIKRFRRTWPRLDFGPGQLLWCEGCKESYVYKGKGMLDDIMSLVPGIAMVADEFAARASRNEANYMRNVKLNRPWVAKKKPWWFGKPSAWWPGSMPSKKYAEKIEWRARILGAAKEDMRFLKKK